MSSVSSVSAFGFFLQCNGNSNTKVIDSKKVKIEALFKPNTIKLNDEDEIISGKLKENTMFYYKSKIGKEAFAVFKKGTVVDLSHDGLKGTLAADIVVELSGYTKTFNAGDDVEITKEGNVIPLRK